MKNKVKDKLFIFMLILVVVLTQLLVYIGVPLITTNTYIKKCNKKTPLYHVALVFAQTLTAINLKKNL